jgi:hypothetical protein
MSGRTVVAMAAATALVLTVAWLWTRRGRRRKYTQDASAPLVVRSCGWNGFSQLGLGHVEYRTGVERAEELAGKQVLALGAGGLHYAGFRLAWSFEKGRLLLFISPHRFSSSLLSSLSLISHSLSPPLPWPAWWSRNKDKCGRLERMPRGSWAAGTCSQSWRQCWCRFRLRLASPLLRVGRTTLCLCPLKGSRSLLVSVSS